MPMPKSVVKFKRDGIEFTSSVDRANYTIRELTRRALTDVGRLISRECNKRAQRLRGLRNSRRVKGKTSAFQFWVRKKETDLQVGIKHNTWYGVEQELGTNGQPKRGILRGSTYDNIDNIIKIEAQYLSAIEDDLLAEQLINENEMEGASDA